MLVQIPPIETSDFKQALGYKLSRAARVLQRVADQELKPHDLTRLCYCVLSALYPDQARSPAELAAEIGMERAAVSRILKRLEGQGLIRRAPNASDRRGLEIALTPQGRAVYQNVHEPFNAALSAKLAKLSAEEKDVLCKLLDRISEDDATAW